jgi:ribosomal-protein-alanine N-acetyltransferase
LACAGIHAANSPAAIIIPQTFIPYRFFIGAKLRNAIAQGPRRIYLARMPDRGPMPIPTLATTRLVLRELRESDAPAIFRLRSDPRVMRFIPKPLSTESAEAVQMVREFHQAAGKGDAVMWAITVKGTDALVGYIGYWRIIAAHHRAEIGYALLPDLWGQGLIGEALEAALDHGFRVMGLHSVEANVTPGNTASIHVLERSGFLREGHFRENFLHGGTFIDTIVYSKLSTVPRNS